MIEEIWLCPPLAVARLGSSPTICDNFEWGPTDRGPGGTGKTTLRALDSLELDANANPSVKPATGEVVFKDRDNNGTWHFRPVCPYFELHGRWTIDGQSDSGPITKGLLAALGIDLSTVTWRVRLANLKAYQFTLSEGDKLECFEEIRGDTHSRVPLALGAPHGPEEQRLLREGASIPIGAVQVARPIDELPELRLRFYAPEGLVYGPSNLLQRIQEHPTPGEWTGFDLPGRLILNPGARWPNYRFQEPIGPPFIPQDGRKTPSGIHAQFPQSNISLGLVDDVSDGIIECTVSGLTAVSRIAVGPPDFAPDRRHLTSIQDGLADRVDRAGVRNVDLAELDDLVRDLFERALETSDAMNKDAELDRLHRTDQQPSDRLPRSTGERDELPINTIWPTRDENAPTAHRADALPVSSLGQRKHRRYTALEYLRDRLREDPQLISAWIRTPLDENQRFDRRMPPLMRGSHGGPMNITRRQYEMLQRWVEGLRQQGVV
ncbi:hypothetical protein IYY11_02570 [Methylocystis sp. H62]|uniref:hypothetical protein n=1 Tax=Methylocystis sp. H62 TaxID=2785789 RepID=UPI0018C2BCC9|nr:hypothetical protein [Methylocystis sp. H62]MBG0792342.1 hypothetical protein [Methylocystis sp. H62]